MYLYAAERFSKLERKPETSTHHGVSFMKLAGQGTNSAYVV